MRWARMDSRNRLQTLAIGNPATTAKPHPALLEPKRGFDGERRRGPAELRDHDADTWNEGCVSVEDHPHPDIDDAKVRVIEGGAPVEVLPAVAHGGNKAELIQFQGPRVKGGAKLDHRGGGKLDH